MTSHSRDRTGEPRGAHCYPKAPTVELDEKAVDYQRQHSA